MRLVTIVFTLVLLLFFSVYTQSAHHPFCVLHHVPATHDTPAVLCPVHIQQAEKTAEFNVQYEGYTDEARAAFEFAVDIMSRIVVSHVPVDVQTRLFEPAMTSILGGGTSDFVRDFQGGVPGVWYASALADSISGQNQNPDSFDIEVLMNSEIDWYFGTDGEVPVGHIDFVSVVLHELGHGLGFGSGMEMLEEGETRFVDAVGLVSYGLRTEPFPYFTLQMLDMGGGTIIFDEFLVNREQQFLVDTVLFPNPSPELTEQATSEAVFFAGKQSIFFHEGNMPKIFAPRQFANGSSMSHLDERAFVRGNQDALMTPSLQSREVVHDVGNIFIGVLQDMGWRINPDVLPARSAVKEWALYD